MMDWGFLFQLIGVAAATSGLFRLVDLIEGRR